MTVTAVAKAIQMYVVTWQLPNNNGPSATVQMFPKANSTGCAYTAPIPIGAVHS